MNTKVILSILFIFAFSTVVSSQNLVKEGKKWKTLIQNSDEPHFCYMENFFFRGDSIIEGISYKILYRQSENNPDPLLFGFLREEGNRVYNRSVIFPSRKITREGLLYDFNVKVEEDLRIVNKFLGETYRSPYFILQKIDSENIEEKAIKKWTFVNSQEILDIWYENIGSIGGIIYSGNGFRSFNCYLISCIESDGTVLYHDKNVTPCEDYYPQAGNKE